MNRLINISETQDSLKFSNSEFTANSDRAPSLPKNKIPKVSVIIPVYNGSKYIQTAIKSVLTQTYSDYEIIVIDDGSTDDTREQLAPFKNQIFYLYQENQGSAAARNLGIKLAKGELIAFLDSDDYWSKPEKLATQVAYFDRDPGLGCINTGWHIVDEQGNHLKTVQPWNKAPELNLETWLRKKCVRTSAMVFRKEWLEKAGGFDVELRQSHDVDLMLRLSLMGCKSVWLKEETVCYRKHEENTTSNSLKQAKYVQAVLDKFFSRNDLPESIGQIESQVRYHTLVWIAWYQCRADNFDEMSRFLQKSLDFTPYLKIENISRWLANFKRFSEERGEILDIDTLTASSQWQQLIAYTIGLKNTPAVSSQLSDRSQESAQNIPEVKQDRDREEKTVDWNWHLQQGNIFQTQGEITKAISSYRKALEIKPQLAEATDKLFNLLKETIGRTMPANMSLKDYRELGEVWKKQGNLDETIGLYYVAVERLPNNPEAHKLLGDALKEYGQVDKAIAAYHQSLKSKSNPQLDRLVKAKSPKNLTVSHPSAFSPSKSKVSKVEIKKPVVHKYQGVKIKGFPSDLILPPFPGENNDFSFVEQGVKDFVASNKTYGLSVSIIIPVTNSATILAKTLAAISAQTYPQNLIETIVVDRHDSQEIVTVIQKYQPKLNLIHLKLEKQSNPLRATRNLGIKTATNDYLILLDSDVLPSPQLVEAYMKYFHAAENVALIGDRRFIDTAEVSEELIARDFAAILKLPDASTLKDAWQRESDRKILEAQHKIYEKSNYLKKDRYPFRALVSSNLAFSKKLIDKIGLLDENFSDWGFRDKEFGYRIYNEGYYFVPVTDALGIHQDPSAGRDKEKNKANHKLEEQLFEQKCPVNWYREHEPGKSYEVPKVSIYIPSYNNGKYIKEAIDSVLNQTYTDVEVCICDDGSTDNTLQVLEENYYNHPKVRWISQTNGGIGKASNGAVRLCRGMYIGQLDSDDLLKPDAVATLVECLDKNSYGCVYSSCERIDAEGNYLQDEYSYPTFSREKMLMTSIVHHFRMFRRRDWLRTEGFNEQLVNAVDYDMFLKLSEVCAFYHIEKMLYLRRWHGKNTSFVNVKKQDNNTHVVITYSLERMGLADEWEVYAPDPEQPRKVSFRRKQPLTNVFFFPDYRKSNIYQDLLYSCVPEQYALYSGDLPIALKAIKEGLGKVIFHLHWTNYLLRAAKSVAEAEKIKNQFLMNLFEFLANGGTLIWTIHNVLPHDCPYLQQEKELRNIICTAAQKIHIHSEKSLVEIQKELNLPVDKVHIVPHGNYVGVYPNTVERLQARQRFEFSPEQTVFLFLGQIRQYKGIDDLVSAFNWVQQTSPNSRLLIAGKPVEPLNLDEFELSSEVKNKITLVEKYIPEDELQWFFNAADVTVLPYRKILTSGSLLNAMSFSRPVIAPRVGMTEEIIQDGYNGFLYELGSIQSLKQAMLKIAQMKPEVREKLFQQAFTSIEHLTWQNIGERIFADI